MNKKNITGFYKNKNIILYTMLVILPLIYCFFNLYVGLGAYGFVLLGILVQLFINARKNREINEYISDVLTSSDSLTKGFVVNSVLPLVIVKGEDTIIWYNNKFAEIFYDDGPAEMSLRALTEELPDFSKEEKEIVFVIRTSDRIFRVYGNRLPIDDAKDKIYSMLYFTDATDEFGYKKYIEDHELAYAKIVVDNFEEAINGLNESESAVLIADTDKHIFSWAQKTGGVIKKQHRDSYYMFFERANLDEYLKKGFDELRDIPLSNEESNVHLTLSIGIGIGGGSPVVNEEFCSASIDMALGRGGDQVVVKDEKGFSFYGGTSKETEKRSKVRSRVIAQALRELIESNKNVVIMGHASPDMDSVGSALGIYRVVKTLGKEAYIVMEEENPAISEFINEFNKSEQYDNVLISRYQAENYLSDRGILVIVDTHIKSLLPHPELLDFAEATVVIDHHRKSTDFIENATLLYHEPYASSTAELVSEILQYTDYKIKLKPIECQALYAGMLIDTKNFTFKTGVRTFEAASFLRRAGLDTAKAREFVKCDLETYRIKSKIIDTAKIYKKKIALCKYIGEPIKDSMAIAFAADELLSIKGIDTTFVIYSDGDRVTISARSAGGINVQLIMEKMGGGGHQLSAGTKIEGKTCDEVVDELKLHIDEYIESTISK